MQYDACSGVVRAMVIWTRLDVILIQLVHTTVCRTVVLVRGRLLRQRVKLVHSFMSSYLSHHIYTDYDIQQKILTAIS